MEKKTKIEKVIIGICIAILIFFTVTIGVRFLTRQILIKHFKINNAFTEFIWFDNSLIQDSNIFQINWEDLYPFDNIDTPINRHTDSYIEKFSNIVFSIKNKLEIYSKDFLFGYNQLVFYAKNYDNLIGWNTSLVGLNPSDTARIIHLDNGYLTYVEPYVEEKDIINIANNVTEFKNYLNDNGIDFYYINAGSKVCPYDKQTSLTNYEFSNENGDNLINALSERNVNVIDMRDYMIKDNLDWYNSYYITDHHWKTQTGFWAAGVIAELLNRNNGFKFDKYYFSKSSYEFTNYKKYVFGAQGRTTTLIESKPEDYTKIVPLFNTNFSISVPSKGIDKTGTYSETLFEEEDFLQIKNYIDKDFLIKKDAYECAGISNDALTIIKNNNTTANKDKKILMLQDSFSWYLTSYLACDVGEIDIIYPEAFTGSIKKYIEKMQPDVVIMIMCERNIRPIEEYRENSHTALFDLR